jgi:hypothetical protein
MIKDNSDLMFEMSLLLSAVLDDLNRKDDDSFNRAVTRLKEAEKKIDAQCISVMSARYQRTMNKGALNGIR